MNHQAKLATPVPAMSEQELTDWLCALPPPPGSAATEEEFAADIAEARAQIAAGKGIPHAIVAKWLETAGSSDWLPFQEWYSRRND